MSKPVIGMLLGTVLGVMDGLSAWAYPEARPMIVSIVAGLSDARQAADPFERVTFMIGRWESTIEGQPGKGIGRREYSRMLNNRFIRIVNRSEYAPQEKNPKGEIHEDEGFFSFDRARKRIVLRQFHVEGFVVQYVQDADGPNGELAFTSEAIENILAGYRARETYISKGRDAFEEIFEMAAPGQSFEVYSRQTFTRVK